MPLSVGTRLGHYDITALIGEGGMGQVYQATDTKLNRQVALKILPDAFAADPDRLTRFQREAQVLAGLNHPGIAAIYGLEEADDTRALMLSLQVSGETGVAPRHRSSSCKTGSRSWSVWCRRNSEMALTIGARLGPAEEQFGDLELTIGLIAQDDDEDDDLDDDDDDDDDDEPDGGKGEDEEQDDDYYPPGWSD